MNSPDEFPDTPEDTPHDASPESAMASTERMFLRLTFWQTVLSVAGVFIAVIALYAALAESSAVRQQTAAAVWPFVQFSIEDSDAGDSAEFAVTFTNSGVGPARMRAMRLEIDGKPVRDWAQAVTQLGGELTPNESRSFISGRVLSPGDRVVAFRTTDPALARRFQSTVARPENFVAFCYCSIFDECWLSDSRLDLQNPEAVDACPDFGEALFQN